MEEYFEYKDIEEPDRVKFAMARLKGHAKIWWQVIQLERNRRGRDKITRWDHMVDKLKKQFIPIDYEFDLLKKVQGLKKAPMIKKFGDQRGRGRGHGQGSGRGGFYRTCFHCNEEGHRAYECPQHKGSKNRRFDGQARVAHVYDDAKPLHSKDA